ncbi:hypothetical protein AZE42_14150 [Rhizopogon vesiculosus]|uniref:Uncharacterized protein n=1 Tax=Rhizopogon vesiculosus TaxID=180088 RepID=A0A1J8R7F2_9AGAM|nr:hypothetical protein AZE42_14150 [Rhizopogon vesiculosus]
MTFAPPPSDLAVPRMNRTMQYADACAAFGGEMRLWTK